MNSRVQVAVVDACSLGRDMLTGSLSSHRGIEVCAACLPEARTLRVIRACKPHVAVFWLRAAEPRTPRFLLRFGRCFPTVGRIAIREDHHAPLPLPRGYGDASGPHRICSLNDSLGTLVTCIQELATPATPIAGESFEHLHPAATLPPPPPPLPSLAHLSTRERQVLASIGQGLCNKTIADQLGIDASTVLSYRARMQQKLGLGSSDQLLQFAIRNNAQRPPSHF
jgi:DNA-binding NarL/FixJ family response regulator